MALAASLIFCTFPIYLCKMVSAEPVSTRKKTILSLIVAITEKEKLGLTIDTAILNDSIALEISLGVRATSPRDSSFPGWRIS